MQFEKIENEIKHSDIGHMIIKVAPLIASALFGPAAGEAAYFVGRLFNADINNPSDIATKIQADPDAETKLKQLEIEKGEHIAAIAENKFALAEKDRENARQRELELAKLGKFDKMPAFLTGMLIVAFVILTVVQLFPVKSLHSAHLIESIADSLARAVSYYFGS